MDFELKNEVVPVTGGAKGIGAAVVRTLAGEATIPVIVDKDVEAANALHSQLPGSEVVIAELSSPESCYAAVDHAIRKFSRLDALANNAGVNDKVGLEHGSPQKYVESLELSIGVGVSGILAGTDSTILQGVANSAPRLGFHWRHEAVCT